MYHRPWTGWTTHVTNDVPHRRGRTSTWNHTKGEGGAREAHHASGARGRFPPSLTVSHAPRTNKRVEGNVGLSAGNSGDVRDTPPARCTASGMKCGSREHKSERHAGTQRTATIARHALHTLDVTMSIVRYAPRSPKGPTGAQALPIPLRHWLEPQVSYHMGAPRRPGVQARDGDLVIASSFFQ